MAHDPIVVAYNATEEAADGLALADLLARLTAGELVVARVLPDMIAHATPGRAEQLAIRRTVAETRQAVVAAIPDDAAADIVPLLDPNLAKGLHAFAEAQDAAYIVVGSTHLGELGRRLLGGSAQLVVDGARCPVAVASPGFRFVRKLEPPVVSVAYDGRPHSRAALAVAASLADAAGVGVRVVTVAHRVGDDLPALPDAVRVDLGGDPRHVLTLETLSTGLLVMGSHGRGPLRRALLGSVSAHVLREAHCPVVICPP